MDREKIIVRTSIIGIAMNCVLVAFKMFVGAVTGSIAVILDAVNNLGDALSSLITIVGTKLSNRKPDRKHPYGYGRIEYLTSVIVAALILAAGITSAKESVVKIIHPVKAEYDVAALVIIAVAVIAKLVCGRYVKSVGVKVNAGALIASGSDALFDAIISASTFVAAIISIVWNISLEGILGLIISVFVGKAGIEMLLEGVHSLIGERADADLTKEIKAKIASVDGINGAYDLVLHNYGPDDMIGTVHCEVDDHMTVKELHKLTRKVQKMIFSEYGIVLTVGIYASNTDTVLEAEMQDYLRELIAERDGIIQSHGLYIDTEDMVVSFDLVIDFNFDSSALRSEIIAKMTERYPQYTYKVNIDTFFSD